MKVKMKIQYKIVVPLLVFLLNIDLSQEHGVINAHNVLEATNVMKGNLEALLSSQRDLMKLSESKLQMTKTLQHTLLSPTSINLTNVCPVLGNESNHMGEIIQQKIVENSEGHGKTFEEISKSINCNGITPEQLETFSTQLKLQMDKFKGLIGRLGNLEQKVENHRPVTQQPANAQLTQLLREINGKLNSQELKLQEMDAQIPSIEKALQYFQSRKKQKKCERCYQLDIMNTLYLKK